MEGSKSVKHFSRVPIILGLVVVCVIGYVLLHHKLADTKKYNLNNFSLFRLGGNTSGTGISFEKPKEFEQTSNTINLKTEAQFGDSASVSIKDGIKLVNLASTSAVPSENPINREYISSLATLLNNHNSDDYKKYTTPLFDFVKRRSLESTVIKFDNAQQLSLPNLKSKDGTKVAWDFKFSGTDKKHPGYKIKGDFIVITTSKGFYYFFLMSKDSTWDANQEAWTKVINSIKVDQ